MTRLLRAACLLSALVSSAVFGAADPKVVATCDACHGANGVTAKQDAPTLAGVSAPVTSNALKGYKAKARPCPSVTVGTTKADMCSVAKDLSDSAIADLADHYSKLTFAPMKQRFGRSKGSAQSDVSAGACFSAGIDSPVRAD